MADNKNIRKISTVAGFLRWVEERYGRGEGTMLYRGLPNADWEVEAGSYRRLRNSISNKNPQGTAHQTLFAEDNKRLLQKMRMEKYWEGSDLELLAKMQHDGVATCLIDFTAQPLVALWFACQPSPAKNKSGKVVAIDRDGKRYTPITPEDMEKKKIWDFLSPENKQPKLWVWEPPGQNNNRIIAQHSVFVFGHPEILINKNDSCIVKEKNKKKILKELQNIDISAESLFRDYAGFILLNKHDEVYENWPIDGSFYSGLMNQQIGEYGRAIKCYDKVIDLGPKGPAVYYNRGNANRELGDNEEAMKDYEKAINSDSEYVRAYISRGMLNSEAGRYEKAMEDYDEAIDLDSENANAYGNRGALNRKLGRYKEAIADYKEAIKNCNKAEKDSPNVADLYYYCCLCKNKVGNMKGAAADYRRAKKLASGSKRFRIPRKLKEYMDSKESK